MKNPIIAFRESLGISRADFVRITSGPYNAVWGTENGTWPTIPKKILLACQKLGADVETLKKNYLDYKESLSAETIARYQT